MTDATYELALALQEALDVLGGAADRHMTPSNPENVAWLIRRLVGRIEVLEAAMGSDG